MSKLRNILPFWLAMAAQGYDIRSAQGYTQCTGRGNESKPISAGKKKRPVGKKKLSKKQRRK